jgi:hypothetical protein
VSVEVLAAERPVFGPIAPAALAPDRSPSSLVLLLSKTAERVRTDPDTNFEDCAVRWPAEILRSRLDERVPVAQETSPMTDRRGGPTMPDWLVAGICIAVGYTIAARWPRRRLYATAHTGGSVIPPGASPMPGDDDCARLGHTHLAWVERISWPWLLPWKGRQRVIVEATCRDCGRSQTRLRIVYPAGHTIEINQPSSDYPAHQGAGTVREQPGDQAVACDAP